MGLPEPGARHYLESLRRGQAIMAVELPADAVRNATELMRRLGARAVDEMPAAERAAEPAPATASASAAGSTSPVESLLDQVTVPVVEEQLEVGKRQVQRGGVRINSHVVEQPIQRSVSLREERVTVERRPVSRDATEADLADFKEGSIEIHETVEEPVISKRRRVVEEIVIGKQTRERTETISETVRRTEVSVEPLRAAGGPCGGAAGRARACVPLRVCVGARRAIPQCGMERRGAACAARMGTGKCRDAGSSSRMLCAAPGKR